MKVSMSIPQLEELLRDAEQRAEAAEAFKRWVHAWLDAEGVPHDPDPVHTAEHGCRISGRMQFLKQRAVEAKVKLLREALKPFADCWESQDPKVLFPWLKKAGEAYAETAVEGGVP